MKITTSKYFFAIDFGWSRRRVTIFGAGRVGVAQEPAWGLRQIVKIRKIDGFLSFRAPPNPETMRETTYQHCFSCKKKYYCSYEKYFLTVFLWFSSFQTTQFRDFDDLVVRISLLRAKEGFQTRDFSCWKIKFETQKSAPVSVSELCETRVNIAFPDDVSNFSYVFAHDTQKWLAILTTIRSSKANSGGISRNITWV